MTYFPYGESVTLWPFTGAADDGMGNELQSWGEGITMEGCALAPTGSVEPRNGLSLRVTDSPQLQAPQGYVIKPRDKISRGSETYEVEGYPAIWKNPLTGWMPGLQVVNLKRIEG